MRTNRCLLLGFSLIANLLPTTAQAELPAGAEKYRFAYVYLNDEKAAAKFQQLLTENNQTTDLIPLDAVTTTEWVKYSAVIVGSDIERAWSTPAAKAIANAKVPVLGLGEGGYYFFGKLNLGIGSPNGYHGGEVGVRAAEPTKTDYWTASNLNQPESDELMLYSSTGHVAIFLSELSPGEIPLGYELNNKSYAPIIEQDRRNVLWGFTASPEKMTPIGKRLFVQTCQYVARSGHSENVAAQVKHAPALKSQFAFIYLKNDESTTSFKQLLDSNGLTVDLVGLEDVPKTDFTHYQAVIAGPDIERAWGEAGANIIAASKKPVLGLGEGGAALFEKLHLQIGWMNTYQGGEVGLRAAGAAKLAYWTSAKLNLTDSDEQLLYSSTGHVAVFLSKLSPNVIPLGYELKDKKYAPLIEQDQRYVLWGFRESPLKMTPLGKRLFVHTCRYVAAELGSDRQLARTLAMSATTSTSTHDPVAQLSQRVRQLEARILQLEQSRQSARSAEKSQDHEATRKNSEAHASNAFAGVWLNVKGRDGGIPKVSIDKLDTGWTIRAWGACEPADCDWGGTKLHLMGDTVASSTFPYGFAKWDHGFAEVNATLGIEDDQLVIGLYEIFKDDSGRSNYRTIARFRRDNPAPNDASRPNRSVQTGEQADGNE